MNKKNDNNERLVLENYESDFFYEKNKSNLNITFNRIAFIFFVFLIICTIYSIKIFYKIRAYKAITSCYNNHFLRINLLIYSYVSIRTCQELFIRSC